MMMRLLALLSLLWPASVMAQGFFPGGLPNVNGGTPVVIMTRFDPAGAVDLPTSATSVYYGLGRIDAQPNATETTADLRTPVPAMKCYGIACAVNQIGTASDALSFTLRDDAATVTGVTCTMTTPAVSCAAMVNPPVAVAAGSLMAIQATGISSPTATSGACFVYCTVDVQ